MENNRLSRSTYSFGVSLAVCAVLNAALVVAKESNKTVADWMQKITGHHWMTHVLFILTGFVALGWLLNRRNSNAGPEISPACLIRIVTGGVAIGILIILGFYLLAG